jgi:hypothetical protein
MIYLVANKIGSDCATREGFQCPQCEVLAEITKWTLHHLASAHLITERKWKYMRTSRVHMTSRGFERVAGEKAMISVSFVNLRKHFSGAYRRNSVTSVFNADCFLLIVASFKSSMMLCNRTISGVGCVDSCGVFLPPGFRARQTGITCK